MSPALTTTSTSRVAYVLRYCGLVAGAELVAAFSPVVSGGLLCVLTFGLIVHAVWLMPPNGAGEATDSWDETLCASFVMLALVCLASLWALMLPVHRIFSSVWPALVAAPTLVGLVGTADVFHINVLGRWRSRITLGEVAVVASAVPMMFLLSAAMPDRVLGLHHAGAADVVIAAITAFALGIVEELVFRGALQPCVIDVVGRRFGVIAVAAVSALVAAGNRSIAGLLLLFVVGLGFGYVAMRSGSVRAPALARAVMLAGLVVLSGLGR